MSVQMLTHQHLGASGVTTTPMINGALVYLKVHDRASSATVDVDETQVGGRKIVDLGASTTDTEIKPYPEATDNTGTGLGVYSHLFVASTLKVTSSANCKVTIVWIT
jgi:hypothetical protein